MPITQTYTINTGDAYEGMVYGLRTAMDIRTVEAHNALTAGFGTPLAAVANTVRGVAVSPSIANDNDPCYGIGVRQINHEAANRPSDGTMFIEKGALLGMMVEGYIMVKLEGDVARDANLGLTATGGWSGKGTTVTKAYDNVIAVKAGKAGDIIPVKIFSVTPATAVRP